MATGVRMKIARLIGWPAGRDPTRNAELAGRMLDLVGASEAPRASTLAH